jgi:hypothetical protein
MTPEERQRLFLGLLMCVHDGDEHGFAALLKGVPRSHLTGLLRSMAEGVIAWQLASEEGPGSARARLACEALAAAGR